MGKKRHSDLLCKLCGTDIEVPMCCKKDMTIKNHAIICSLCANSKSVPICCGEEMHVVKNT